MNRTINGMIAGFVAVRSGALAPDDDRRKADGGCQLLEMNLGVIASPTALMLHLVFGAILGFTYQKLPSSGRTVSAWLDRRSCLWIA